MAVAISQTANPAGVAASSNVATYAATANNIGAAASDRIVAICVGAELASAAPSAAQIDYGGGYVSMTAGSSQVLGAVYAQMYYLPVPTGTQASFKVTFSATNPTALQNHIAVYRIVGSSAAGVNPSGTSDTDADPIDTGAVVIPTDGGMLAICADATDTTVRTWTGLTKDLDVAAGTGTFRFSTGFKNAGGSTTTTVSGGNNEDAAISWLVFEALYACTASALTTSGPSFGAPTATQQIVVNCTAASLAATTPAFGAPTATRAGAFTGVSFVEESPVLETTPAFDASDSAPVDFAAVATSVAVSSPSIGAATLSQKHVLAGASLAASVPVFGTPAISQKHVLNAAVLAASVPAFGAPSVVLPSGAVPASLTVTAPAFGAPTISQKQVLSATALATSAIAFGAAFARDNASINIWLGDYTIDNGLAALALADQIIICSALPTDYADAISKKLGGKTFGAGNAFGSIAAGSPSGRKRPSIAVTDGSVTASGTVAQWAAIDSVNSRLLASGLLNGAKPLTSGMVWKLGSFDIHMNG